MKSQRSPAARRREFWRRLRFAMVVTVCGVLCNVLAAPVPGAVPVLLGGIAPAVLAKHMKASWVLASALLVSAPLVATEWVWFTLLQGSILVAAAAFPAIARRLPWVLAVLLVPCALLLTVPSPHSIPAWLLGSFNLLVGVVVAHFAARQLWVFVPSRVNLSQRSLADQIAASAVATLWPLLVLALLALSYAGWKVELGRRAAALELRAEQAALVVSDHLEAHERAVVQAAADVGLPTRPPVLDGIRQAHRGFLTLLVTDAQGVVIDFRSPSASTSGRSVADREYFQEPKRSGASYISPVFQGRGFGTDILVAVSAPYLDEQRRFAGVVQGSLSLTVIEERLRRIAQQHVLQLVLTDATARVVLSTLESLAPLDPAVGKLIEAGPAFASLGLNHAQGHALSRVTVAEHGWTVLLLEPLAPLAMLQSLSFALTGSAVLLGLLLLEWLTHRFAEPFARPLREMVSRVRALDLGVPSTLQPLQLPASSAEFESLADDFNVMVQRLRDLSEDLRRSLDAQARLNRELEARVEQRTADLAEALARAERLADAKTRFLSQMSHELRTPLTAILGFAEQAMLDRGDRERIAQALQVVVRNGRHLLGIVNDVLDAARIDAGQLSVSIEPSAPVALVDEVHGLLLSEAEQRGIRLDLECRWPLPAMIDTDPLRLRQVLINLLGNALKFTERGAVRLSLAAGEGRLQIEVRDTGIGISGEQLDRLFKPFEQADASVTRRFGGSGLGLFISKRWVEAMGGALEVESALGEGSCFRVYLPLAGGESWIDSRATVADTAPDALRIPRLAGRVLVVDDVADLRELIVQTVSATGVHCETAANGAEAVERARAQTFDLILLDKHMPVLDGYSAMRQLRASGYAGAIATLSADVLPQEAGEDTHEGFNAMLAKPIDRARLYEVLLKFVPGAHAHSPEPTAETAAREAPEARALQAAIAQIRARFGGRLLEECEALQQAASVPDLDGLLLRLHSLKGSAGTFGFAEISAAAAEAESALHQGAAADAEALAALLAPLIQAMRAAAQPAASAEPSA